MLHTLQDAQRRIGVVPRLEIGHEAIAPASVWVVCGAQRTIAQPHLEDAGILDEFSCQVSGNQQVIAHHLARRQHRGEPEGIAELRQVLGSDHRCRRPAAEERGQPRIHGGGARKGRNLRLTSLLSSRPGSRVESNMRAGDRLWEGK